MSPLEILAILGLTVYAIYKQTKVSEVSGPGRFKLAIIYAIVGVAVGGFALPHTEIAVALLATSFGLSVVVGLARGYLTPIWQAADGKVYRQGTVLTVSLFLGLIASKFALGTFEYVEHVRDSAGFGEIMVMIAIMMAVQAEIIWRRSQSLTATQPQTQPQLVA